MLKAVIVDDERLAREKLKRLLEELGGIQVIGEAADGPEAVSVIDEGRPDFVILDIQMPGMSGLDVLRHLSHVPPVIFSTAFDQYAVRAFDVNAVDYLLKPYDADRLSKAIDRIRLVHRADSLDLKIRNAIEDALREKGRTGNLERLPVRFGARIKLLPIESVAWFESEHSMTFAHVDRQKHDVRYTLDELESRLSDEMFFRMHRSRIINLAMISEIIPWFNGQLKVRLKGYDRDDLVVSRSRASALRSRLQL